MTEYRTILIGSESGDHVSITPTGSEGQGWIHAEIEVHCDCWSGRMPASFTTGEFVTFAQGIRQLYRDLIGTAEMRSLEPSIILKLSGDGKGHVSVDGMAQNDFARGTKLIFRFDIDQTFLKGIAEALSEGLSR